MRFKKELTIKQYIEILKTMSSIEIFDEYKEFIKLIKVIDHFIKRVSFLFINISKEILSNRINTYRPAELRELILLIVLILKQFLYTSNRRFRQA